MRKRLAIYGVSVVLLVAYVGFLVYCSWIDGVTEANYAQLEIGMTKRQVRGMLGFGPDVTHRWLKDQIHEDWVGDDGTIMLAFDEKDRLVWKGWEELRRRPTLSERWDHLGENVWYFVRE